MVRLLLVVLGLFHIANGALMLLAPGLWYTMVPGVIDTGPLNQHFIYDIGMAYIASGAMLVLGARRAARPRCLPVPARHGRRCTRSSTSKGG